MPVIGFHAQHEQAHPRDLRDSAVHAEQAGFDAVMCSDHLADSGGPDLGGPQVGDETLHAGGRRGRQLLASSSRSGPPAHRPLSPRSGSLPATGSGAPGARPSPAR
jgi:alkanesulfonate monooxygenase SsuD/methylene tetrahydromethanopterin reductase-like flavin-dependent oxidoreductase (luciferase family)